MMSKSEFSFSSLREPCSRTCSSSFTLNDLTKEASNSENLEAMNSISSLPSSPRLCFTCRRETQFSLEISSVETSAIRKDAAFDGHLEYGQESTSVVRRNLMNPDEIIRMNNDEQIIIIRGQKPFKCKKLRYWEYRLGTNLEKTAVTDYTPIATENKKFIEPMDFEKTIKKNKSEEERLPTFAEFLNGRR